MSHHPNEPLVEIVGIEEGGRGRSCEEHSVCGQALAIDSVVRFRSIQTCNGESISTARILYYSDRKYLQSHPACFSIVWSSQLHTILVSHSAFWPNHQMQMLMNLQLEFTG
jgi:hypothetical protein